MIRHPSISVGCSNVTEMMTTVSLQIVGIIEPIIQHADWFFPGGEEGGREGVLLGGLFGPRRIDSISLSFLLYPF